jgi:hypothetical protein
MNVTTIALRVEMQEMSKPLEKVDMDRTRAETSAPVHAAG